MKLYYLVSWGGNGPDRVWLVRADDVEHAMLIYQSIGAEAPVIDMIYQIGIDVGVSQDAMILAGPISMHAINQGWASWMFVDGSGWVKQ